MLPSGNCWPGTAGARKEGVTQGGDRLQGQASSFQITFPSYLVPLLAQNKDLHCIKGTEMAVDL